MLKNSHLLKKDGRVAVFGRKWLLSKLYFTEYPGLGFELSLNPVWACVIIKNSTLQCLWSPIPRTYFSPSAIHMCSGELLVQFLKICIYLQFFPLTDILKKLTTQRYPFWNCYESINYLWASRYFINDVVLFCVAMSRHKITYSQTPLSLWCPTSLLTDHFVVQDASDEFPLWF